MNYYPSHITTQKLVARTSNCRRMRSKSMSSRLSSTIIPALSQSCDITASPSSNQLLTPLGCTLRRLTRTSSTFVPSRAAAIAATCSSELCQQTVSCISYCADSVCYICKSASTQYLRTIPLSHEDTVTPHDEGRVILTQHLHSRSRGEAPGSSALV